MRILLNALLFVSLASCNLINAVRSGNAKRIIRETASTARKVESSKQTCDVIRQYEVNWEEELAIGGAVSLALASKSNGIFIESSAELPTGPLDSKLWADKKVRPGKGRKTELHRYLNLVAKNLASYSKRPGIPWKVIVLDSDTVNAFSAPGGYLFLTTATLRLVDNEAQLAGILAHEIGHVTGKHALNSYRQTKLNVCHTGIAAGFALDAADDALPPEARDLKRMLAGAGFDLNRAGAELITKLTEGVVDDLTQRGLGADLEHEADATAVELLFFAGYDPKEYAKLLARLPAEGSYVSPHPPNKTRIDKVKAAVADLGGSKGLRAPELDDRISAVE